MNTIVSDLIKAATIDEIQHNFLTTLSRLKLYKRPNFTKAIGGAVLIPPGTYISKVRIKT